MDADGRIIPLVEGDQGEGIKDPIDDYSEILKEQGLKLVDGKWLNPSEAIDKLVDESKAALKDTPKKQGLIVEGPSQYLEPSSPPPPKRMKMQLGMPIDFYGYRYKVVRILNTGRIMLKLECEIPGRK